MSFRFAIVAALTDAAAAAGSNDAVRSGSFVPRKIQTAYFDTKKTTINSNTNFDINANHNPAVDSIGMVHKLQPETDESIPFGFSDQQAASKTLRNVDFQGTKETDSIDLGILGNNPKDVRENPSTHRELEDCTDRPLVSNYNGFQSVINSCLLNLDDCPYSAPVRCFDTSEITDMSFAFYSQTSFDEDLSGWDTSKVTSFNNMFYNCLEFNQPLESWDTSKATDIWSMFHKAKKFNQPVDSWDTSKVLEMRWAFKDAEAFNQPLESWETSSVTDMYGVFVSAKSFDQPLGSWDLSSVTIMDNMFQDAESFNQPLDDWDISAVTSMNQMFLGAGSFDQCLSSWASKSVEDLKAPYIFSGTSCPYTEDPNEWCQGANQQCEASEDSSSEDSSSVNSLSMGGLVFLLPTIPFFLF